MVTIATALVVLGTLLLMGWNVDRLVSRWSTAAEMSVYLRDDAGMEAVAAVEQMLTEHPVVAAYELISKDEARVRFAQDFPDLADLDDRSGEKPFPASFEVRLAPPTPDSSLAEQLGQRLEGAGGVEEVRFDQAWVDRVVAAVDMARRVGFGVVLVLLWGAFLLGESFYGAAAARVLGGDAVQFLPISRMAGLVVGGMVVGCLGGLAAATSTAGVGRDRR